MRRQLERTKLGEERRELEEGEEVQGGERVKGVEEGGELLMRVAWLSQ